MAQDLQSAGIPQDDPGSLLKALSMGGTQSPMFQGSPLQQAQQNPDLKNYAGLAGFGAGLMGQQNPVISQLLQQQEQDMRQRLATVSVMQSVQRQRREKEKDQLAVLRDLTSTNDPNARRLGWTGIAKITGVQIPPGMLQGLSAGDLTPEMMNRVAAQILGGWDDATITKFNPGLPPESIPAIRQYSKSDAAKAALKIETQDKLEKRMLDEDVKRARIQVDELKGQLGLMKEERLERRMELTSRQLDIAQQRADQQAKWIEGRLQDLGKKMTTKESRRVETLNVLEDAINMMESHAANLDKKGYLPRGTSILDSTKAKGNQTIFPGDPDWVAWKQLQASLIGFDRSVLNDIGARAFQAFKNQFAFFDNPPPKAAIDQTIVNMRRLLKDAREGKIPEMETVIIKLPNGKIQKSTNYRHGDPLPPGAEIIRVE